MKLATCLAAAALLAGCSSLNVNASSPRSWSLGSWSPVAWLDAVRKRGAAPAGMSDEQAASLQQEAAQLRRETDVVWARLAAERDREQRFDLYHDLGVLRERLATIERSLRDAGRPVRAAAAAAPAA